MKNKIFSVYTIILAILLGKTQAYKYCKKSSKYKLRILHPIVLLLVITHFPIFIISTIYWSLRLYYDNRKNMFCLI